MSLRWMLSASPNRAYLRDRESNLILLLWSIFTQFILILQEAFVRLERSTFVLVSYAVICSVLWYMVLILILIGGDYIIWSLLVVVSCYASSTLDQHKTTILVPLVRYSVLCPKIPLMHNLCSTKNLSKHFL